MKLWRLVAALLVTASLGFLSACGTDDDLIVANVAFTPLPTATPVPKLCGNGTVDQEVGEQCDPPETGNCAAGESCVCCLCLADGEELGEREFSIARPPSKFLSSALFGGDVTTGIWLPGPIKIKAGRPDATLPGEEACSAELSLSEDAIFGFGIVDGTTLCNKLFAGDVTGVIDCDGGTPQDIELTQDSNGLGDEEPIEVFMGLGDGITAGPGAASLSFARIVSVRVGGAGLTAEDLCPTLDYENPLAIPGVKENDVIDGPIGFTTKTATGIVTEPRQGTDNVTFESMGENFSCATWNQENAEGILVGAIPGLDAPVINQDTVNMFFLADKPQ